MKNKLLLGTVLTISSVTCFAQKKENTTTPTAVKTAFAKAFPGAVGVKWEKEKADYEAEFKLNGKQMAAVYDNAGTLKETEEDITITALPAPVTGYIKQHYANAAIKEAAKITKPGGEINYEAEVNKKDLIFDADGKFIREEKDKD